MHAGSDETQRVLKILNNLNQIIEKNPQDAFAWMEKGKAHRQIGQFDESINSLEKARDIMADSSIYAELGETFRIKGDLKKALSYLEEATRLNDKNEWAWERKGAVQRDLNHLVQSRTSLERAKDIRSHSWIYAELGDTLRRIGDLTEALSHLEKAIKLDDKNYWAWERKGVVQREMRNFEDAIAAQKKAIFLKPDNLWACIELGECLRLKGRLIKALDIMDSVLMKDANHPRALRRKGVILRALGNYEQAKICLLKAIEHEPNNAWSYSELGETYRVMGNYEEALEMLRLALNIEKENPNSWTLARMGAIYWHMNKAEKALSFLEESIKKDSSYVFALKTKALVLCDCGQFQEAFDLIESIINDEKIDETEKDEWLFIAEGWAAENLSLRTIALSAYSNAYKIAEKLEFELNDNNLGARQKLALLAGKFRAFRGKADIYYEMKIFDNLPEVEHISLYKELIHSLYSHKPLLDPHGISQLAWCNYRLKNNHEAISLYMESFSYRQSAQILFDIGLAMISDGKKTDMVQQKYDQGKNMCERDCDIMRRQGLIKLALRYLKIELRNDYKNYNKIFNYLYNAYLDIAMELLEKKDTQLGIHVYMDVIEDLCKADPKGPILGLNCRPLLRRALIDLKEPKLTDINELAPVRDAILNAFESQTS